MTRDNRCFLSGIVLMLVAGVLTPGGRVSAGENSGPTLEKGDRIVLIGNTLADRMQHDGWLETYFHSRFPKHQLVIRNLGFSGDELTLRLRSMDFGTPDQWLAGSQPIPQPRKLTYPQLARPNRLELTETRADVVLAFFGYNESFWLRVCLMKSARSCLNLARPAGPAATSNPDLFGQLTWLWKILLAYSLL